MRSDEREGDMADDPPISVSNYNKTTLLGVSGDEVKTSIPSPAGREATGGGDGGDEDRLKSIPGEGCDSGAPSLGKEPDPGLSSFEDLSAQARTLGQLQATVMDQICGENHNITKSLGGGSQEETNFEKRDLLLAAHGAPKIDTNTTRTAARQNGVRERTETDGERGETSRIQKVTIKNPKQSRMELWEHGNIHELIPDGGLNGCKASKPASRKALVIKEVGSKTVMETAAVGTGSETTDREIGTADREVKLCNVVVGNYTTPASRPVDRWMGESKWDGIMPDLKDVPTYHYFETAHTGVDGKGIQPRPVKTMVYTDGDKPEKWRKPNLAKPKSMATKVTRVWKEDRWITVKTEVLRKYQRCHNRYGTGRSRSTHWHVTSVRDGGKWVKKTSLKREHELVGGGPGQSNGNETKSGKTEKYRTTKPRRGSRRAAVQREAEADGYGTEWIQPIRECTDLDKEYGTHTTQWERKHPKVSQLQVKRSGAETAAAADHDLGVTSTDEPVSFETPAEADKVSKVSPLDRSANPTRGAAGTNTPCSTSAQLRWESEPPGSGGTELGHEPDEPQFTGGDAWGNALYLRKEAPQDLEHPDRVRAEPAEHASHGDWMPDNIHANNWRRIAISMYTSAPLGVRSMLLDARARSVLGVESYGASLTDDTQPHRSVGSNVQRPVEGNPSGCRVSNPDVTDASTGVGPDLGFAPDVENNTEVWIPPDAGPCQEGESASARATSQRQRQDPIKGIAQTGELKGESDSSRPVGEVTNPGVCASESGPVGIDGGPAPITGVYPTIEPHPTVPEHTSEMSVRLTNRTHGGLVVPDSIPSSCPQGQESVPASMHTLTSMEESVPLRGGHVNLSQDVESYGVHPTVTVQSTSEHTPRAINSTDSDVSTLVSGPVPDTIHAGDWRNTDTDMHTNAPRWARSLQTGGCVTPMTGVESYGVHPTDAQNPVLNYSLKGVTHDETCGVEPVCDELEGDQLSGTDQTDNKQAMPGLVGRSVTVGDAHRLGDRDSDTCKLTSKISTAADPEFIGDANHQMSHTRWIYAGADVPDEGRVPIIRRMTSEETRATCESAEQDERHDQDQDDQAPAEGADEAEASQSVDLADTNDADEHPDSSECTEDIELGNVPEGSTQNDTAEYKFTLIEVQESGVTWCITHVMSGTVGAADTLSNAITAGHHMLRAAAMPEPGQGPAWIIMPDRAELTMVNAGQCGTWLRQPAGEFLTTRADHTTDITLLACRGPPQRDMLRWLRHAMWRQGLGHAIHRSFGRTLRDMISRMTDANVDNVSSGPEAERGIASVGPPSEGEGMQTHTEFAPLVERDEVSASTPGQGANPPTDAAPVPTSAVHAPQPMAQPSDGKRPEHGAGARLLSTMLDIVCSGVMRAVIRNMSHAAVANRAYYDAVDDTDDTPDASIAGDTDSTDGDDFDGVEYDASMICHSWRTHHGDAWRSAGHALRDHEHMRLWRCSRVADTWMAERDWWTALGARYATMAWMRREYTLQDAWRAMPREEVEDHSTRKLHAALRIVSVALSVAGAVPSGCEAVQRAQSRLSSCMLDDMRVCARDAYFVWRAGGGSDVPKNSKTMSMDTERTPYAHRRAYRELINVAAQYGIFQGFTGAARVVNDSAVPRPHLGKCKSATQQMAKESRRWHVGRNIHRFWQLLNPSRYHMQLAAIRASSKARLIRLCRKYMTQKVTILNEHERQRIKAQAIRQLDTHMRAKWGQVASMNPKAEGWRQQIMNTIRIAAAAMKVMPKDTQTHDSGDNNTTSEESEAELTQVAKKRDTADKKRKPRSSRVKKARRRISKQSACTHQHNRREREKVYAETQEEIKRRRQQMKNISEEIQRAEQQLTNTAQKLRASERKYKGSYEAARRKILSIINREDSLNRRQHLSVKMLDSIDKYHVWTEHLQEQAAGQAVREAQPEGGMRGGASSDEKEPESAPAVVAADTPTTGNATAASSPPSTTPVETTPVEKKKGRRRLRKMSEAPADSPARPVANRTRQSGKGGGKKTQHKQEVNKQEVNPASPSEQLEQERQAMRQFEMEQQEMREARAEEMKALREMMDAAAKETAMDMQRIRQQEMQRLKEVGEAAQAEQNKQAEEAAEEIQRTITLLRDQEVRHTKEATERDKKARELTRQLELQQAEIKKLQADVHRTALEKEHQAREEVERLEAAAQRTAAEKEAEVRRLEQLLAAQSEQQKAEVRRLEAEALRAATAKEAEVKRLEQAVESMQGETQMSKECDSLKAEITQLKVMLEQSTMKEQNIPNMERMATEMEALRAQQEQQNREMAQLRKEKDRAEHELREAEKNQATKVAAAARGKSKNVGLPGFRKIGEHFPVSRNEQRSEGLWRYLDVANSPVGVTGDTHGIIEIARFHHMGDDKMAEAIHEGDQKGAGTRTVPAHAIKAVTPEELMRWISETKVGEHTLIKIPTVNLLIRTARELGIGVSRLHRDETPVNLHELYQIGEQTHRWVEHLQHNVEIIMEHSETPDLMGFSKGVYEHIIRRACSMCAAQLTGEPINISEGDNPTTPRHAKPEPRPPDFIDLASRSPSEHNTSYDGSTASGSRHSPNAIGEYQDRGPRRETKYLSPGPSEGMEDIQSRQSVLTRHAERDTVVRNISGFPISYVASGPSNLMSSEVDLQWISTVLSRMRDDAVWKHIVAGKAPDATTISVTEFLSNLMDCTVQDLHKFLEYVLHTESHRHQDVNIRILIREHVDKDFQVEFMRTRMEVMYDNTCSIMYRIYTEEERMKKQGRMQKEAGQWHRKDDPDEEELQQSWGRRTPYDATPSPGRREQQAHAHFRPSGEGPSVRGYKTANNMPANATAAAASPLGGSGGSGIGSSRSRYIRPHLGHTKRNDGIEKEQLATNAIMTAIEKYPIDSEVELLLMAVNHAIKHIRGTSSEQAAMYKTIRDITRMVDEQQADLKNAERQSAVRDIANRIQLDVYENKWKDGGDMADGLEWHEVLTATSKTCLKKEWEEVLRSNLRRKRYDGKQDIAQYWKDYRSIVDEWPSAMKPTEDVLADEFLASLPLEMSNGCMARYNEIISKEGKDHYHNALRAVDAHMKMEGAGMQTTAGMPNNQELMQLIKATIKQMPQKQRGRFRASDIAHLDVEDEDEDEDEYTVASMEDGKPSCPSCAAKGKSSNHHPRSCFDPDNPASSVPKALREGYKKWQAVTLICRLGSDSQIVRSKLEDMGIDAMQFYETLRAYRHAEGMRGGHIPPCGCAAQDMEEGQVDFKKLRECKANRALNKVMQMASKTTMNIQELQYQQEVAMLEEMHK